MKKIKAILVLFAIFAMPFLSISDPPGGPDPNLNGSGTTNGTTPVGAPIDGGLGILIILGAGYGIKKVFKARKTKSEE
jgi:hypothetical protein